MMKETEILVMVVMVLMFQVIQTFLSDLENREREANIIKHTKIKSNELSILSVDDFLLAVLYTCTCTYNLKD